MCSHEMESLGLALQYLLTDIKSLGSCHGGQILPASLCNLSCQSLINKRVLTKVFGFLLGNTILISSQSELQMGLSGLPCIAPLSLVRYPLMLQSSLQLPRMLSHGQRLTWRSILGNHARSQEKRSASQATAAMYGARGARFPTKVSTHSTLTLEKQQTNTFKGRALLNKPRVVVALNTYISEKHLNCYFSIRIFLCLKGAQRFLALCMPFTGEETEFHREVRG